MGSNKIDIGMENIREVILFIRGKRVILDSHLAALYGTTTSRLLEQVRRNKARFPEDFCFKLTTIEKDELIAICDRFNNLKHLAEPPRVFTEHGAIMAANVLRSEKAVQMSVFVVRAFVQMRDILGAHKALLAKVEALEEKYDGQFKEVFYAIRQLMLPEKVSRRRIGF